MKIVELLNPEVPQAVNPAVASPAPQAAVAPPATGGAPAAAPMQTAGLGSAAWNFMSTPHPIGGQAARPQPAAPNPNAPPAQSSGMISRPYGNTAPGNAIDQINTGLQKGIK